MNSDMFSAITGSDPEAVGSVKPPRGVVTVLDLADIIHYQEARVIRYTKAKAQFPGNRQVEETAAIEDRILLALNCLSLRQQRKALDQRNTQAGLSAPQPTQKEVNS